MEQRLYLFVRIEQTNMILEPVDLKTSPLNEAWVQKQIAADPKILGLGNLVLRDKERIQPRAGRLDLLLQDPESLKRLEVVRKGLTVLDLVPSQS